jgi:general secretion pathway protein G
MKKYTCFKKFGFTLIELIVVLSILAVLAAIATPLYLERVQDAREAVLKKNLYETRKVIDQFYRDVGRYPKDLNELVSLKYIREIPLDTITQKNDTWKVIKENNSDGIVDLRSTAQGIGRNGVDYANW